MTDPNSPPNDSGPSTPMKLPGPLKTRVEALRSTLESNDVAEIHKDAAITSFTVDGEVGLGYLVTMLDDPEIDMVKGLVCMSVVMTSLTYKDHPDLPSKHQYESGLTASRFAHTSIIFQVLGSAAKAWIMEQHPAVGEDTFWHFANGLDMEKPDGEWITALGVSLVELGRAVTPLYSEGG